jgi:hypothetical protein
MRFGVWARAVAACALVGATLGVGGAAASAATVAADPARAAAAKLVGFVPEDVRYQCTMYPKPAPGGFQTAPGAILVGLTCPSPGGVGNAEYYLFSDNAAMNDIYAKAIGDAGSQPTRSAEANCPSDGTWEFSGHEAGRLGCYYGSTSISATGEAIPADEFVGRVWTYDAANILAIAGMPPGNTDAIALQSWWNDKAGPTKTADVVDGVVPSASGAARDERALLTHIPAATRKNCKPVDATDPANASYYETRLWLRAAVTCTTTGGADEVIYESFAPSVVAGFMAGHVSDAKTYESATQTNPHCPETGTYSTGKGKKAHTAGEYACFNDLTKSTYQNGVPYAQYIWSDNKLGIIGYATSAGNDADALATWYQGSDSGPV